MPKTCSRCPAGPAARAALLLGALLALSAAAPPAGPVDPYATLKRTWIRPADLPRPYATPSATNPPRVVPAPNGALPRVPPGFEVFEAAGDFALARTLALTPDGQVLLAESDAGRITLLLDADRDGRFEQRAPFAAGLDLPFGLAFADSFLYVGCTTEVVRFAWRPGDRHVRGDAEVVVPHLPAGGHWTRNLAWDAKRRLMFVSVGSAGNINEEDAQRAAILAFEPNGAVPRGGYPLRVYASGLRNPVGLTLQPATGDLWTCVNERDGLGDALVPDYATRVTPGGFYGWPYSYIGRNPQPGFAEKRPDLVLKALTPDVLFEAHSAALGLVFYDGTAFPAHFRGGAFVTHHGSWNRARRVGYKVVYLPVQEGNATGWYEDFLTGFSDAPDKPEVWGRPVGLLVDRDGSLLVSDDGGERVWRVRYRGTAGR